MSDTFCRTVKYLLGLALAVPCVSYDWINDNIKQVRREGKGREGKGVQLSTLHKLPFSRTHCVSCPRVSLWLVEDIEQVNRSLINQTKLSLPCSLPPSSSLLFPSPPSSSLLPPPSSLLSWTRSHFHPLILGAVSFGMLLRKESVYPHEWDEG